LIWVLWWNQYKLRLSLFYIPGPLIAFDNMIQTSWRKYSQRNLLDVSHSQSIVENLDWHFVIFFITKNSKFLAILTYKETFWCFFYSIPILIKLDSSDGSGSNFCCLGWVGSAIFGLGLALENFPLDFQIFGQKNLIM